MEDPGGGASRTTDPATGSSAATDVSLREFLHAEITNVERRSEARFQAMQEAVDKALEANERRFEGVNEFRAALEDSSKNNVTRLELAALVDKLQASIDRNASDLRGLSQKIDRREGELIGQKVTKGSMYAAVTISVMIMGLLVVLANYVTGR